MRLYNLDGATVVTHAEHGDFTADGSGAFVFPPDLGEHMHRLAIDGKRVWEDDAERQDRLDAEEEARRKDPATLLAVVEQLVAERQAEAAAKRLRKAAEPKP